MTLVENFEPYNLTRLENFKHDFNFLAVPTIKTSQRPHFQPTTILVSVDATVGLSVAIQLSGLN
jgi:hypothetical protein